MARVSALSYESMANEAAEVTLQEHRHLRCALVSAWSDQYGAVVETLDSTDAVVLQIEPLKWWVLDQPDFALNPQLGTVIEVSHSRSRIVLAGPRAVDLLNRVLPLDLRIQQFAVGSVASSAIHHVGVTLWHSEAGYELFVPRNFAQSIWDLLVDIGRQFELAILPAKA